MQRFRVFGISLKIIIPMHGGITHPKFTQTYWGRGTHTLRGWFPVYLLCHDQTDSGIHLFISSGEDDHDDEEEEEDKFWRKTTVGYIRFHPCPRW